MKKTTRTAAILSTLALLAVGCQKEDLTTLMPDQTIAQANAAYTVHYTVDGEESDTTLRNKAEHDAFITHLFDLAEQGYRVVLLNNDRQHFTATKAIMTYSTTDKTLAEIWVMQMKSNGYYVSISYDSTTKTYNCAAWK